MLMIEIQNSFLSAKATLVSVEKKGSTYVNENDVIYYIEDNKEFVARGKLATILLYELDSDYCLSNIQELNVLTGRNLFEVDKSKTAYMKKRYKELQYVRSVRSAVYIKEDMNYEQATTIAKVLQLDIGE